MKEVNFGDRRPSVGRYAASDASRPETVDCAFGNAGMLTPGDDKFDVAREMIYLRKRQPGVDRP